MELCRVIYKSRFGYQLFVFLGRKARVRAKRYAKCELGLRPESGEQYAYNIIQKKAQKIDQAVPIDYNK